MAKFHRYLLAAVFALTGGNATKAARANGGASLIRACDLAAMSAADPDKPPGLGDVAFNHIDPKVAVPACEAAAKVAPGNRRIAFELARAYDAEAQPSAAQKAKNKADDLRLSRSDLRAFFRFYGPGEKGRRQYRAAAALGSPMAQYALCTLEPVEHDRAEALEWCRRAADAGIAAAVDEYDWGNLKSDAVEGDKYLELLKRAARLGDAIAKSDLVVTYNKECSPIRDVKKAAWWKAQAFPLARRSARDVVPPRRFTMRYAVCALF